MSLKVYRTLLKSLYVFRSKVWLCNAAVVLEGADSSHEHYRVGNKSCFAALDVEELLSSEVSAKARLGYGVFAQLKSELCSSYGVTAVGDVCERSAVNKSGSVFKSLNEVRLDSVLKQSRHRALCLKVTGKHGSAVVCISHENVAKTGLEVVKRLCKAENSHYLAGNGYHKVVLSRYTVNTSAKTYRYVAQSSVVGVGNTGENYSSLVDTKLVALLEMVVNHSAKQIVCGGDSMEVTCEVQVDILHRNDLRISSARSSALDSEYRAERRLTQSDNGVLSELVHSHTETYRGRGFALARGGGVDSRYENQLTVRTTLHSLEKLVVYLRLILAVKLKLVVGNAEFLRDFGDGKHRGFLCDFDIRFHI